MRQENIIKINMEKFKMEITQTNDGIYRLKIESNNAGVAHGSYVEDGGEEVEMFFLTGHLEKKLGPDYFKVGREFNMKISDGGSKREYVPVSFDVD